jgi:hypothetical protein
MEDETVAPTAKFFISFLIKMQKNRGTPPAIFPASLVLHHSRDINKNLSNPHGFLTRVHFLP